MKNVIAVRYRIKGNDGEFVQGGESPCSSVSEARAIIAPYSVDWVVVVYSNGTTEDLR